MKLFFYLCIPGILFFSCHQQNKKSLSGPTPGPEAVSLLGQPLYPAEPSEKLLRDYQQHKAAYESNPANVDKLIWFGRFTAYKGSYREAIALYTRGIDQFPDDARLYRHRGHRYITLREFDLAIKDLEHAARLIEGKPNAIEPDGMPNAKNIPVSTLHGNIWYHLGLAYYLTHDLTNALRAYTNCLAASGNADNLVSSTHWIYMILRRMDRKGEADRYLEPITDTLEVIENIDYHRICLFYKGALSMEALMPENAHGAGSDAISYAIGKWHFYHGNSPQAREVFERILARKSWNSFGYIAAEAQYAKGFD